jgi:hypothetical protein
MDDDLPRRAAVLLAALLAVAVGLAESVNDFRGDDWIYLRWYDSHRAIYAWWSAPPPFPYIRPLNALTWMIQAHLFGTNPWPIQVWLLAMFWSMLALLFVNVERRAGALCALCAVMLALSCRELRELADWRSWTTTVGVLAGLQAAIAAADRGRPGLALLFVALGAGFKEGGWWHGAWVLALLGFPRAGGAALAAYVVHGGITAARHGEHVGLEYVPAQLETLGSAIVAWGWPLPVLAVAALAPGTRWKEDGRLAIAALAAVVPALGFYRPSPVYYLEGLTIFLVAVLPLAARYVAETPRAGWVACAAGALLLARPAAWSDFTENVSFQGWRMTEGRDMAERGAGAVAVWAPHEDAGPCGLAADLLVFDGARRLAERPPDGHALGDCVVVLR